MVHLMNLSLDYMILRFCLEGLVWMFTLVVWLKMKTCQQRYLGIIILCNFMI